MDSMLISSINIKKYDKDEIESPLEKILKMWYIRLNGVFGNQSIMESSTYN
jgi:hypothetical protein